MPEIKAPQRSLCLGRRNRYAVLPATMLSGALAAPRRHTISMNAGLPGALRVIGTLRRSLEPMYRLVDDLFALWFAPWQLCG